ncbi:MAG TPA: hypothetical protein VE932_08645 [Patescibacteria group bacterium]|nr:hypothetical protein [Patescibacteria group bacterium]
MPPPDVLPALREQRRHQVRAGRARRITVLLVAFVGVSLSALGLHASAALWGEGLRPSTLRLLVLAYGFLAFGGVLAAALVWPFFARCRIVPYFAREMGSYPCETSAAFARGHELYRQSAALDGLTRTLGVTPLSAFGFGDDLYGQPIRWSPAADGLRTVTAVRDAVSADSGVTRDLDTLASVLRVAADRGVGFALLLRVGGGDVQSAAVFEPRVRRGRFW